MNAHRAAPPDTGLPETPGIPTDPETPAELRERIEHTRRELGDTLEELAARTDVRALAHRRASEAARAGRRNARPLAAVGGAVVAVAVAVLVIRQRRYGGGRAQARPWQRLAARDPRPPASLRRLVARRLR